MMTCEIAEYAKYSDCAQEQKEIEGIEIEGTLVREELRGLATS